MSEQTQAQAQAAAILDNLARLADDIEACEARLSVAYTERVALYQAGQALDHGAKITQERLAEAARVSEVAVNKALAKAKRAAEGDAS